ncbi:MAG: superoxide dismutase family protein [Ekhidna sp.]|uniref:superoxide dismutase family protein n=1 Tax=Ekhidna sp. TaxID=2608089 RepID=UPI0032EE36AC
MKKLLIIPLVFLLACSAQDSNQVAEPEIVAEAKIFSINQLTDSEYEVLSTPVGKATFTQTGDVVTISISLKGMEPNTSRAVHIHDGTLEAPGRHWNAGRFVAACGEESLGSQWQKLFIGDVGNVPIGADGRGEFTLHTDLWSINSGDEKDILDKILIVHQNPEDFAVECDPFHSHDYIHTNKKIGGGEIKLVSDVLRNKQSAVSTEQITPNFLICR